MLKYKNGKELDVGHCMMGTQIWEILATVSTEAIAQSSFGEAWQAYAEIWIFKAVFPVTSSGLNRTDTCIARKSQGMVT